MEKRNQLQQQSLNIKHEKRKINNILWEQVCYLNLKIGIQNTFLEAKKTTTQIFRELVSKNGSGSQDGYYAPRPAFLRFSLLFIKNAVCEGSYLMSCFFQENGDSRSFQSTQKDLLRMKNMLKQKNHIQLLLLEDFSIIY